MEDGVIEDNDNDFSYIKFEEFQILENWMADN